MTATATSPWCRSTWTCPLVEWLALTSDHTQEGAEVTHRLYAMNARPIDGLVSGGQYYVLNRTASTFQLSHTLGGAAIDLGIVGRAAGDAAGSFLAGPVDLGAATGVGRIVIDLSAAASGTQVLKPISQFGTVPNGSRISATTVRSSGGGFVNVQKAETTTYVNADIAVSVGAGARVTSGGDFLLTTDALGLGSADSTNGGGGFVAVGASQSSSTVIINTRVTVGSGAVIESKWNLHITSTTRGDVRAFSNAKAGGLGAGVDARSKANLTANTTIDIDGSLIAEHLLGIHGYAQPNGNVSAEANASGLGADSSGNDCGDCGLYVTSNVDIDIAGSGTVIRGDEIDIVAQMGTDAAGNGGSLRAWGYSRAKALGADSDARSRVQVRGGSTVTVHTGVVMTAWERMRLATVGTGLNIWSASRASCGCLGGDTDSAASIDYQTTSRVLTQPGVLVETAHLYVDTIQNNPGWHRDTDRSGGAFDGGSQSGGTTNIGNRPIVWEADVILHDDNPQLYIAEDGTILKKYGVTVSNGAGTYYNVGDVIPVGTVIHVDQITNDGHATADFTINLNGAGGNRDITGTRGSFRLQNTFDFVRLYNWSNRSMVLSGIDVVNLDDLAATVSVRANNQANNFRFTIREPIFTETRVEAIHYWLPGNGTNDLTLGGTIYNPIGTTVVDNQHGNILSLPGVLAIVANKVELTAMAGSIGQLGGTRTPVQVRLVESMYGTVGALTTRQVALLVDALNDAVLDLTISRRSIAVGPLNWVIDGLHAGGTIDLVLGDTLIGTDRAPFGSYEIQADVYRAGDYVVHVAPTGRFSVYFHPNSALPAFSYTDQVLVAFGTSNAAANSRFTFTDIAADVISIRHLSVASVIDLIVYPHVDANLVS